MKRPPAFMFYPADYLSDMRVRMLSWASRGLYMDLLCYCWREGWIPSDSSAIAQLCHCQDLAIVEPCLALFDSHPDDPAKLVHRRLVEERNAQIERSEERAKAGKKGSEARWNKGKPKKKQSDSSAIKQPLAKNSLSSSSSIASSTTVIHMPEYPEFEQYLINELPSLNPEWTPERIKRAAKLQFDTYVDNGWKDGNGKKVKNWKLKTRNIMSYKKPWSYGNEKPQEPMKSAI